MPDATAPTHADPVTGPVPERYDSLPLPDGVLVIFDCRASECWIQSDVSVSLETTR